MKQITITQIHISLTIVFLWGLFFVLNVYSTAVPNWVTAAVGLPILLLIPGFLIRSHFNIRSEYAFGNTLLSIGLSVLFLMLVGLFINGILPGYAVFRPLEALYIGIFGIVTQCVFLIPYTLTPRAYVITSCSSLTHSLSVQILFVCSALLIVTLSWLGAESLNADQSNFFAVLSLVTTVFFVLYTFFRLSIVSTSTIAWILSLLSMALLLSTSLRSDFVIGHDIQREFAVFQLTKEYAFWSIALYRDAYNACLSITVLPTIFSSLLSVADPYIYKVIFQGLFALVPGALFLTVRNFVTDKIAFISVLFFIATPTFFSDMPFLIRQEIAFLFLALFLFITFSEQYASKVTKWLGLAFGLGMVLSHYSTTYTVVALFIFVVLARPVVTVASQLLHRHSWSFASGLTALTKHERNERHHISIDLVVIMVIVTMLWSQVITGTSSNSLNRVVGNTIEALMDSTDFNERSDDVNHSLFAKPVYVPPEVRLEQYSERVRNEAETLAGDEQVLFEPASKEVFTTSPIPRDQTDSILSPALNQNVTNALRAANDMLKSLLASGVQILILLGFWCAFLSRRFLRNTIPTDLILYAVGSLTLVVGIVVLPVLSVEYGVLRAFQQGLMVLGLFISLGVLFLVTPFSHRVQKIVLVLFLCVYMTMTTGLGGQLLGGYEPPLHLTNDGPYYDMYYLRQPEVSGLKWLARKLAINGGSYQSELQINPQVYTNLTTIVDTNHLNGIHPALIRKHTYVFTDQENVQLQQGTLIDNGSIIRYSYPIVYLDAVKDRVYDNGTVRIYK